MKIIDKLRKENKHLKEEIMEMRDKELVKKLNDSLDRIKKGHFVKREELGL